jgi:hypothetical protein
MPILSPACGTGYTPRSSRNDLGDVIEDHLEEFFRVYDERYSGTYGPLHPRVRDLMEAYTRCGDPHFGFLRVRCSNPDCQRKHELILPFSCKARGLCPSCGQKRALLWAERMVREVLPDVPYVQLVFTIPKMLRKPFLFDRTLYGDLCRSAYEATRKFFQAHFPTLEKAVPAMLLAPQSFGSLLNHHPHAHALTSLGVFTRDGIFHPAADDIDFSPLEELFREEVFKSLLKKDRITPERIDLLRSWRHSGFNISSDRRIPRGERAEIEDLLQYMVRAPVSLARLQYRCDGRVLYRGNFHPSLGRDYQLASGLDFLAMLVPHIALRYEARIYTYGALSTTIRRELGWARKDEEPAQAPRDVVVLEDEEGDFARVRRRSWRRLIARVWLQDPQLCPSCGEPMRVVSAIESPHQDEVIQRILRHLGLWDPPWKRQRRARAPPPAIDTSTTLFDEEFSQLPPQEEEDLSQDPPGPDEPL